MSKNALSSKIFLNSAFKSALIAVPSVLICSLYFSEYLEISAAALISIGLGATLQAYLDENRTAIWKDKRSPYLANSVLALQLIGIFLGIFLPTVCFQAYSIVDAKPLFMELSASFDKGFILLFLDNVQIMFVGILFAFWYRSGGLMLLLAWQAVHWALSFHYHIVEIGSVQNSAAVFVMVAIIVPYLVLEVLAFVLAGMSGVFMSKALEKYSASSDQFIQVTRACIVILAIAIISLFLATVFEAQLAQKVFAPLIMPL